MLLCMPALACLEGNPRVSLPSVAPSFPLQASQQLRDMCHAFLLSQLPEEAHAAAEVAAGRAVAVQIGGGGSSSAAEEGDGMALDEGEP